MEREDPVKPARVLWAVRILERWFYIFSKVGSRGYVV